MSYSSLVYNSKIDVLYCVLFIYEIDKGVFYRNSIEPDTKALSIFNPDYTSILHKLCICNLISSFFTFKYIFITIFNLITKIIN